MFYGSRKTLDLIAEANYNAVKERTNGASDVLSEVDNKIIELRKERQKFFDQRAAFNKVVRERSRQEELNEIIRDTIRGGTLPELRYDPCPERWSDNDMLVSLNDIHYGIQIDNAWNKYDPDICKDYFRQYLDKILTISERHHCENCFCWMNGDAISGNIHYSVAVANKENVVKQVVGVSELISEFLAELSRHFVRVYFVSVAGNHSRIDPNKDLALPEERLDNLIGWHLKARLQNFESINIVENNLDTTMYKIDIRGKCYCGVHGDFDSSDQKIQSLQIMAGEPLYAVLLGHKHHNKIDSIQGIKTVMAGSFMGVDSFCIEKRIFGEPEQLVCICDESGIVCSYDIRFQTERKEN